MPPKKPFAGKFKLQLPAQSATPAPPVGPVIGQHGLNIQAFVQAFQRPVGGVRTGDDFADGVLRF